MYEVMLEGTEFIITVRVKRLTQFETENESSYERHLRNHIYEYSLTKSVEFAKLCEVLTSKQRELKQQGLENLNNR